MTAFGAPYGNTLPGRNGPQTITGGPIPLPGQFRPPPNQQLAQMQQRKQKQQSLLKAARRGSPMSAFQQALQNISNARRATP